VQQQQHQSFLFPHTYLRALYRWVSVLDEIKEGRKKKEHRERKTWTNWMEKRIRSGEEGRLRVYTYYSEVRFFRASVL
jgi:hypothetical protein